MTRRLSIGAAARTVAAEVEEAMSLIAVYHLDIDHDDPRIERFVPISSTSLLGARGHGHDDRLTDFYPAAPIVADWVPPTLNKVWIPLEVSGRIRIWNDYPKLMEFPAFSRRAVDALRDLLNANGELLPLRYKDGEYWAYNLRTVVDIINPNESVVIDCHRSSTSVARSYYYYSIRPERLDGLTIFRMRHDLSDVYVTQPFVDRVRTAGLRNFVFEKIWPWPKGTIWYQEARKQNATEREQARTPDLACHSLVIRLETGTNLNPNKQQREHVEMIMNSLDALLSDPGAPIDAAYFGRLEGSEPFKGEYRLYFSCPDADKLVDHLRSWLHHLDWPGSVQVVKRYGEMRDEEAREETAEGPW